MDVNIDNQAVKFQMTQVCEGNNVFVYVLGLLFPIGISPKECKSQWMNTTNLMDTTWPVYKKTWTQRHLFAHLGMNRSFLYGPGASHSGELEG